ncbi:MAG: hypothetical protein GTO18_12965 [Anaerolineales bacterium]|nr:hypothetical protein [Anaerolineales bacterium]
MDEILNLLGLGRLSIFTDNEEWARFILFESSFLADLQLILAMIESLAWFLPLLALVCFLVAWWISRWRRKTVLYIGASVSITMLITLILLKLVQPLLVASITEPLLHDIASEILRVITRGLVIQTIMLMILGIVIAAGAWLMGPNPRVVETRNRISLNW